jgi:hypothetical protein
MDKTAPIQVEVTNHPQPKKYLLRGAYRSIVLTAANPYQQICGPDPLRVYVTMSGVVNAVVICDSISQASDLNNAVNPVVQPNGRYIPAGASAKWDIEGHQEIWVVASVFPTIVGYTLLRKVPE